jgi:hypothetical protein
LSAQPKEADPGQDDSVLPPGWRDRTGFWLPLGYEDPRTLVRRRRRAGRAPKADAADPVMPA